MKLDEYRRKRRFGQTAEPPPEAPAQAGRSLFVVQKHAARRLHYDLRLQVGGVLRSWAVPREPSYDPKVKRLAVEVEDHPLAYADFEGDIPAGQYGAGHVECYDRGVWSTEGDPAAQLRKGHLRFTLWGRRLQGEWHLVRGARKERQQAWFLIKAEDGHATSPATPAPRRRKARKPPDLAVPAGSRKARITRDWFAPELAQPVEQPPSGDGWLHEVKWDGYRLLTAVAGGKAACWSRNQLDWTARVPELAQAVEALGLDSARLDGELVALREGRADFGLLQQVLSGASSAPLHYVLFDIVHCNGRDLSRVPLHERKALLETLLQDADGDRLIYSAHHQGEGREVLQAASRWQVEGIVSKRADSPYRAGRGGDWRKAKFLRSEEFAVVGHTPGKGSRAGVVGSLLLARPAPGGGWTYAGRVGSGLGAEQLRELQRLLRGKAVRQPPVREDSIDPLLRQATWVRPERVAEVFYRGLGNHGLLRQPSFKTLRLDKRATDLREPSTPEPAMNANRRRQSAAVTITHPDRVVFPDRGITKQDVADYYAAVMDAFLPGVAGRATSVLRCPEGTAGDCFFQKHALDGLHHTDLVKLKEAGGRAAKYLCPRTPEAVLELVQFGVLEFHPWGAPADDPEHATFMVLDLDPAPGVAWARVVKAARLVRDLLGKLQLVSFLRATGGKGLHVVVPLNPPCAWGRLKPFAQGFARALAGAWPDEFLAVANKRQREGRIFVDYLRNSRGATSIASYSLRARAGAPVAVPLRWEELGRLKGSNAFDIHSARRRLARLKSDPWEGFDELRQGLGELDAALFRHG
ncbi:DNA ligase D [Fulvimonas sp. R45]|uniref:DNA ligase D n=1 Tax=Fulvimonas sp. R45 TaxID=3045937 RepID=UPI00265F01D3|nr:DNA ligase D [Fulvimonas sp. R45]MDO1527253.1 DNA ligase D [Fulvimonas sp. R45]